MLGELVQGLVTVLTPQVLLLLLFGVSAGFLVGAMPGLTATMAVALLVPLTFPFGAARGLSLLLAIYVGAVSGGLVPAILINTPGTPASIATTFDGYPMTKRGEAGKALSLALLASVFGSLIGIALLIALAPAISRLALGFSGPEYASLAIFGLTMAVGISGKSLAKGMIAVLFGLSVSMIGLDPMLGSPRFTFDTVILQGGVPFVPMLIGMFAVSEAINRAVGVGIGNAAEAVLPKRFVLKFKEIVRNWFLIIKSGVIGTFIGAIPGAGADIASLVSYGEAKRSSKHPERFGTGIEEGVIASETANNAIMGGAMIPLLTLGIPGDAVTAVLLGAMMMHGVRTGPLIFQQNRAEVFVMYAALIVSVILFRLVAIAIIKPFSHIVRLKQSFIVPAVLILCFVGSFATGNNLWNLQAALIFGVIGFLMTATDFPVGPAVLGFILGPLLEDRFRQALIISQGSFAVFFTRPISALLLILSIVSVVYALRQRRKSSG